MYRLWCGKLIGLLCQKYKKSVGHLDETYREISPYWLQLKIYIYIYIYNKPELAKAAYLVKFCTRGSVVLRIPKFSVISIKNKTLRNHGTFCFV